MKLFLFTTLFLLATVTARCQDIRLAQKTTSYVCAVDRIATTANINTAYKHKHCVGVRLGTIFIATGGLVSIIAGAIKLGNSANSTNGDLADVYTQNLLPLGATMFGGGLVAVILGKSYENKHPDRYGIIANKHEMGLVYNF